MNWSTQWSPAKRNFYEIIVWYTKRKIFEKCMLMSFILESISWTLLSRGTSLILGLTMKVLVMCIIESDSKDILSMRMRIKRMIMSLRIMLNKFRKILIFGISRIKCRIKIILLKIHITKKIIIIKISLKMRCLTIRISKLLLLLKWKLYRTTTGFKFDFGG